MGPGDAIAAMFSVLGFFGAPIVVVAIWAKHKQKMAEIDRQGTAPEQFSSGEIKMLRDEIARLRDTTTQYDISVEHTLDEIKQRLSTLENRAQYAPVRTAGEPEQESLIAGRQSI